MKAIAIAWLTGGIFWLVAGLVDDGTHEAIWLVPISSSPSESPDSGVPTSTRAVGSASPGLHLRPSAAPPLCWPRSSPRSLETTRTPCCP